MKVSFMKKWVAGVILLGILLSCNKSTDLGKDLLKDSLAETKSTNQLTFQFEGGRVDSVLVYEAFDENSSRSSNQVSVFVAGDIDDPVFGHTESEIYTQFRTDPRPDLNVSASLGFAVDSAYMVFYYDTLGFYGDTNAQVDLSVYPLAEAPDIARDYYSTSALPTLPAAVGTVKGITPSLRDSFDIYFKDRFGNQDTFLVRGAVKVPITDMAYLDKFLLDTTPFYQPKELSNFLPGIKIEVHTKGKRTIGLDLNSPRSFIQVYYHSADTSLSHRFYFDERLEYENPLVKLVHQTHDYTGTQVDVFLQQQPNLPYAYLQGLSGVRAKIKLGDIPQDLNGEVTVNLAKLHLPVRFLPGDDSVRFSPPLTIVTSTRTDQGAYVLTKEAQYAWEQFVRNRDLPFLNARFGGVLSKDDNGRYYYDINISSYVQDYLLGRNDGNFYISLVGSQNNPKRVVFCTPNSTECSAGLKVIYTKY